MYVFLSSQDIHVDTEGQRSRWYSIYRYPHLHSSTSDLKEPDICSRRTEIGDPVQIPGRGESAVSSLQGRTVNFEELFLCFY